MTSFSALVDPCARVAKPATIAATATTIPNVRACTHPPFVGFGGRILERAGAPDVRNGRCVAKPHGYAGVWKHRHEVVIAAGAAGEGCAPSARIRTRDTGAAQPGARPRRSRPRSAS